MNLKSYCMFIYNKTGYKNKDYKKESIIISMRIMI
jgi:hypothetical protein